MLTLAPLTAVLAAGAFDGPLPRTWMTRALFGWRFAYVAALLGLTIVTQTWLASRGGARGDYGIAYNIREAQAQVAVDYLESRGSNAFFKRGEARPGEGLALDCHGFPAELQWIVRSMDPTPTRTLDSLSLCDYWVEADGRLVYRWTVRDNQVTR